MTKACLIRYPSWETTVAYRVVSVPVAEAVHKVIVGHREARLRTAHKG
jgi:hypothetical protein